MQWFHSLVCNLLFSSIAACVSLKPRNTLSLLASGAFWERFYKLRLKSPISTQYLSKALPAFPRDDWYQHNQIRLQWVEVTDSGMFWQPALIRLVYSHRTCQLSHGRLSCARVLPLFTCCLLKSYVHSYQCYLATRESRHIFFDSCVNQGKQTFSLHVKLVCSGFFHLPC